MLVKRFLVAVVALLCVEMTEASYGNKIVQPYVIVADPHSHEESVFEKHDTLGAPDTYCYLGQSNLKWKLMYDTRRDREAPWHLIPLQQYGNNDPCTYYHAENPGNLVRWQPVEAEPEVQHIIHVADKETDKQIAARKAREAETQEFQVSQAEMRKLFRKELLLAWRNQDKVAVMETDEEIRAREASEKKDQKKLKQKLYEQQVRNVKNNPAYEKLLEKIKALNKIRRVG